MTDTPTSVSFGGGLNSTALLAAMHARGERPTWILFADTGGEHAHTYEHVEHVRGWLARIGWPDITVVSNADPAGARHGHVSLEDECLRNKTLPSLAYGFKGCSVKWKRQPMERWLAAQPEAQATWGRGERVTVCIGIDAGEAHRSAALVETPHAKFAYRRPLVEWGIDRDGCEALVRQAGLQVPHKSACWFCPANKKREVLTLHREHPDLFARAVAMERNAAANNSTVRGLGRHYSWEGLARADAAQARLWPETIDSPCMCADGTEV